jgi:hypothetical protein
MATEKQIVAELVHKRTENSKTYLLSDGSYRAIIYGGPVHYPDHKGNLHNINTKAYDEGDADTLDIIPSRESAPGLAIARERAKQGKAKGLFNRDNYDFLGLQLPYDAKLPRIFRKGYSIGKGQDRLTFAPVKASPAKGYPDPEHDNRIAYQDAWNDTDVYLELTPTGIKETIVLKSDRAPESFSFEVKGMDSLSELHLQPAWLVDANGTRRDVPIATREQGGKVYVDLTPDLTGLVYPVEIDPTVSASVLEYAEIDSGIPAQPYPNPSTITLDTGRSTLIKFDLPSLPSGATVQSVIMTVQVRRYSNTGKIRCERITSPWSALTVTYDTRPTTTTTGAAESAWVSETSYTAYDINITTIAQAWYSGQNYGMHLTRAGTLAGTLYINNNPLPVLSITYTVPPGKPTVTSPNGGETVNEEFLITWLPATDADVPQSQLRYHIQLTTNGYTYTTIVSLTSPGATSYLYNFAGAPETSNARIRIRAYNGSLYGDYDTSDGVFAIRHNSAPSAPTNLSPAGEFRDWQAQLRFSWTHNDSDGDPQSKYDLRWRLQGAAIWNEITQATASQYYDLPAGSLPKGTIEWQVRTYDQEDLPSPWSAQAVFWAGEKPATPEILSPLNGAAVGESTLTVQWSSSGQVAYQLEVAGLWDSGEVVSTNKARTIGDELENGGSYTIRLRIKNADGIWSDYHTIFVTVSYTPPANPIISTSAEDGYILLTITNPEPTGTEPTVTSNRVWRRKHGETDWERIALDINGEYRDYAVASGVAYQYRVQAIGDNGTTSYSAVSTESITLQGVWLHDVTDPAGTLHNFRYDGRGRTEYWDGQPAINQYAGRTYPVAVWDESEQHQLSLYLQLWKRTDDYTALLDLVRRKATICYRDGKGRKAFVVMPTLTADDVLGFGANATLPATRVDYSEEV